METKKRRVLIMYATMTSNTEKVASWFAETFDEYNWDVKMVRIKGSASLAEERKNLYFNDYDVICLGSPIVGGSPLQPIIKAFSLGGGGNLEMDAMKQLEKPEGKMNIDDSLDKSLWRREPLPYPGVLNKNHVRKMPSPFYGASSECF